MVPVVWVVPVVLVVPAVPLVPVVPVAPMATLAVPVALEACLTTVVWIARRCLSNSESHTRGTYQSPSSEIES